MQKLFKTSPFISAPVLGFILLIPIIALEIVNRWKFHEKFPFAIFTFTWVLQTLFILILVSVIKTIVSGTSLTKLPLNLLLRVVSLVLIAYIWGGWIVDQWPCLMGVPNCD
jgi:hypothetical protein